MAALPLRVVTAYLCLGTKYNMTGFHADAVKRFTYEYPSDSVECDGEEDLLNQVLKQQQVREWQYVVVGGTDDYKDSL